MRRSILLTVSFNESQDKRLWRRYVYLWINYALYEELVTKVSLLFSGIVKILNSPFVG